MDMLFCSRRTKAGSDVNGVNNPQLGLAHVARRQIGKCAHVPTSNIQS